MNTGDDPSPILPRDAFQSFFQESASTLLAVFDAEGHLLEANRGFRQLQAQSRQACRPVDLFINPGFSELCAGVAAGHDGVVYRGWMTIGCIDHESDSWLGVVTRDQHLILCACERDVMGDTSLRQELFALTSEYARKERELAKAQRELKRWAREVERLTYRDALTGLANRRAFDEKLAEAIARCRRHGGALSLLMLDLDHFKRVNDRFGHAVGDQVLRAAAEGMQSEARETDLLARWGGEEFAVLAPETGLEAAMTLAERMRRSVLNARLPKDVPPITASVGAAELLGPGDSAAQLFQRADSALYRAKMAGRDRAVAAERPVVPARAGCAGGGVS